MTPILLNKVGQLPEGTPIRVVDIPEPEEDSGTYYGWHMYRDQMIGLEGKINIDKIEWGRDITLWGKHPWNYHASVFNILNHSFIVERLDDPDGNY